MMPHYYGRRIIITTAYRCKPSPIWSAMLDSHPDLIGHGEEEADAVYDLFCALAEREAELEPVDEGAEILHLRTTRKERN